MPTASARSFGTWRAGSRPLATMCCCPTCITAPGGTQFLGQMCSRRAAQSTHVCVRYAPKMTIPPVMRDIAAMLAFIDRQDAVTPGPVGCHGYCMSGPYALAAAARYPDCIAAAASFYGTWLVSEAEESPHRSLGQVKGELYIACAEHDNLAPLPMVEALQSLFKQSGAAGELELYPGVHHGFAFPQRWCYDKQAAERHWERLLALYRRRLPNPLP